MGALNIYKVDENKCQELIQALNEQMQSQDSLTINRQISDEEVAFGFTLYYARKEDPNQLSWNWLLRAFNQDEVETISSPKAVLLLEIGGVVSYAVTFGHSFFLVDKFCDREFGFRFARKIDFREIKTSTLTAPSSHRNKTVNTYINYNELDFDSGESYAKLKANAVLPDGFTLFKAAIEVGTSIRVVSEEDSLDRIIDIILYSDNVIATVDDKHRIPVFMRVKDKAKIQQLDERLNAAIEEEPEIYISELDIIGASEIFNHNDCEFKLKYKRGEKTVTSLSHEELHAFCDENGFDFATEVLNITVFSLYEGNPVTSAKVKNLIEFTCDAEQCLLSKGIWYQYNDDYLDYLRASIAEIQTEYNPAYDFSDAMHAAFVEAKIPEARALPENCGKDDDTLRKGLKKKYYAERAYNLLMERDHGFENYDRNDQSVGEAKVEKMDLYKNHTMFAVKIGNTSGKLCYAVDQSLTSLKPYKHHLLENMPQIDAVGVWLVLERDAHIEDANGKPVIDALNMLMLKNRLDQWKKEVRVQGFTPIIYINYRHN